MHLEVAPVIRGLHCWTPVKNGVLWWPELPPSAFVAFNLQKNDLTTIFVCYFLHVRSSVCNWSFQQLAQRVSTQFDQILSFWGRHSTAPQLDFHQENHKNNPNVKACFMTSLAIHHPNVTLGSCVLWYIHSCLSILWWIITTKSDFQIS